jgi:hypothetical protein
MSPHSEFSSAGILAFPPCAIDLERLVVSCNRFLQAVLKSMERRAVPHSAAEKIVTARAYAYNQAS